MEMPKLEPDEPEKVEATDEPIKPMDLAPPMLTDVPQIVIVECEKGSRLLGGR